MQEVGILLQEIGLTGDSEFTFTLTSGTKVTGRLCFSVHKAPHILGIVNTRHQLFPVQFAHIESIEAHKKGKDILLPISKKQRKEILALSDNIVELSQNMATKLHAKASEEHKKELEIEEEYDKEWKKELSSGEQVLVSQVDLLPDVDADEDEYPEDSLDEYSDLDTITNQATKAQGGKLLKTVHEKLQVKKKKGN